MSSGQPSTRSPQELFHGTSPLEAIGIELEGFRLAPVADRFWGRGALGDGIYLTRSITWAREFMRDFAGTGGVVIRVALAPDTRLLWLDGTFDSRRIESLRREFGAAILRPDFHKALPRNKHLKTRELIDLLNFLHARNEREGGGSRLYWQRGWSGLGAVRAQLRLAKYAGFGCASSDIGIVVFNPATVIPASMHRFAKDGSQLLVTPNWLLHAALTKVLELEHDHREMADDPSGEGTWYDAEELPAMQKDIERLRGQLRNYAARHGLPDPS